ncbi:MAG: protein kinase domain-containing protein [Pyrinomonadaceae bacterium]
MLESAKQFGHYRILNQIGAGGMGEVYLAEDTKLDRQVALKILPQEFAEDTERMRRFVQEAKAASALNHPNIITIYEIGETDDTHFIATEYIAGETLHKKLQSETLSIKSALDIAIQVASALQAAHNTGIIHRDIKPENVMIRPDGLVKILDFGIAKLTEQKPDSIDAEAATVIKADGTNPGMIIGTANYMSPEQARGKEVDARSDIFSFGIVLYEMLTGKKPFAGETAMDTMGAILHKEPAPVSQYQTEIPHEIERIINKALKKDRDERYQTAKDLLLDLKDVRQELEFQNKFRVPPGTNPGLKPAEAQTKILEVKPTDEEMPPRGETQNTTSSAEYVVGEVKKHKFSFAVGLIILLAAVGFGYWFFANRSANTTQIESIAVLPFVNESGNADNEYLSDGMTETLISSLSQLPKLSVKARSSVFRYKGKNVNPQTVGNELSVQAVLLGRVLQRGETLTLSLELVDSKSENVIWSEQYNRKQSDLIALQGEIARDVSNKLRQKLTGADERQVTKTYTENPEAYQLYLKGRYHWNKRTGDDLKQAILLFRQAIDKDPSYAKAYAGLALTYEVLNSNTVMTREEGKEAGLKAKSAAGKALELDGTLAEAYVVLANEKIGEWDFAGAENDFKRAIELNPNFATARQWYSELLARLERHDEAIAEVKRAYELDPFSPAVSMNVGLRYSQAHRYDEAIEQFKKLIETEPTYPMPYLFLGDNYAEKGMYEDALNLWCKGDVLLKIHTPESCERENVAIREAIKKDGAKGLWRKDLERSLKDYEQGTASAVSVARSYARLGEKERAFEWLEKAFAARETELTYLKVDESFDNVKSDPRFQDLLRRIGLPQ